MRKKIQEINAYLKINKYSVFFIIALGVMLFLILAMIFFTINLSKTKQAAAPSPVPSQEISPSEDSSISDYPSISVSPLPSEESAHDIQ